MTAKVLQFKPRRSEADVHELTSSIFFALAVCTAFSPKELIEQFRADHVELTESDFQAGFNFAYRVLSTFERLVIDAADAAYDEPDGGNDGSAA